MATASADGSARIFDAMGTELVRLDHDGPVWAVASPQGHPGGHRQRRRVGPDFSRHGYRTGSPGPRRPVWAAAFAPEGTRVATASADGSARIFDAMGTELVRLDHDGPVWAVAFSPEGTRVATASADGRRGCSTRTGAELARLDHDGPVRAVAFARRAPGWPPPAPTRSARIFDATGTELARLDHDDWVG